MGEEQYFLIGEGLKPEFKKYGFIVDVDDYRLGRMIQDQKYYCKVLRRDNDT